MSVVVERTRTWTKQAIEKLIIELLADEEGKDPGAMRKQLAEKGAALPVDSLAMFDILVEFRKRTGLTIPKRKLRRHTMRSVKAFAEFAAQEGNR
jgi:acyl carrier protein